MSQTEDEDPAEQSARHGDVGVLADPSNDNETRRAKPKELDCFAEVWGVRSGGRGFILRVEDALVHRKDGVRARFVAREFKKYGAMNDVFAPSSSPRTGRIIDCLSHKKSHHSFTAGDAYVHVDEDKECYVDVPVECLELRMVALVHKSLYGRGQAGARLVDSTAERLEEEKPIWISAYRSMDRSRNESGDCIQTELKSYLKRSTRGWYFTARAWRDASLHWCQLWRMVTADGQRLFLLRGRQPML